MFRNCKVFKLPNYQLNAVKIDNIWYPPSTAFPYKPQGRSAHRKDRPQLTLHHPKESNHNFHLYIVLGIGRPSNRIRSLFSEFQDVITDCVCTTGTRREMKCNRTSFSDRYAPRSETGERSFVELHRGTGSLHHVRAENIVPYCDRRCADSSLQDRDRQG